MFFRGVFLLIYLCYLCVQGVFVGFSSRVVSDLESMRHYVEDEVLWISRGRLLFLPSKLDLMDWEAANRATMSSDDFKEAYARHEACLHTGQVIRNDGVIHRVEHLVPGAEKLMYYHYDWGLGVGGTAKWPY
jgi:hypothetical protein